MASSPMPDPSTSGQVPASDRPTLGCTWSLAGASECLRLELAGCGVKVTNVQPGLCHTDMARRCFLEMGMAEEELGQLAKKLLQPEDIAEVVWQVISKPERWPVQTSYLIEIIVSLLKIQKMILSNIWQFGLF